LPRAACGEKVNDIDWAHVVEEIEDLGLSELNAVHSYLRQILFHLLKLNGCLVSVRLATGAARLLPSRPTPSAALRHPCDSGSISKRRQALAYED
jgi:hypothetical protein